MRERTGQILKIACCVLAAALLYQLVRTAFRINPLSHVAIPALPSLASDTHAPATGGKPTNSVSTMAKGTNASPADSGTNSGVAKKLKELGTNVVAGVSSNRAATNIVGPLTPALSLSAVARESDPTNSPALIVGLETTKPGTNSAALVAPKLNPKNFSAESLTNNLAMAPGTNTLGGTNGAISKTNSASKSKSKGTNFSAPSAMMVAGMGGGKPADLPPEIKARVDRIYESEIFGMVMRPQPMALQGIAGNSAFLRSPSGQTGLVKEGDSLGELKLLKIGINRVLVEQDGKKSELTIFEGYGSESLMPRDKESPKDKAISK